jgi:alpha-tubulin suppressor-like RCC1 family protein
VSERWSAIRPRRRQRFRLVAVTAAVASLVLATGVAWAQYSATTTNAANSVTSGTWATIRSVGDGDFHSCVVKYDRSTWCWGRNDRMQVGDTTTTDRSSPVQVVGPGGVGTFTNADTVVAGKEHSCARKADATVWCWGRNNEWQLGDTTNTDRSSPVQVVGAGGAGTLTGTVALAGGGQHNCVIAADTTVWCWGRNNFSQLGDGAAVDRGYPVQVRGAGGVGTLSSVTEVAGGAEFTCARRSDGSVWCWGRNDRGQLGDNTTTDRVNPVQVVGAGGVGTLTSVVEVQTGDKHACALRNDASVWCWGQNNAGQLGDNTTTDRSAPVQVVGAGGVGVLTSVSVLLAGSGNHNCVIRTGNALWCWGRNNNGQLGDNSTTDRRVPVQVVGVGGVGTLANTDRAAVGGEHSCAVATDDTLRCWGRNDRGQLGDGSTSQSSTPVAALLP